MTIAETTFQLARRVSTAHLLGIAAVSMTLLGHGWAKASTSLELLHVFESSTEGTGPGSLTRGPDGLLYGTTTYSGPGTAGTVYLIDKQGVTQVLHAFSKEVDGGYPKGRLLSASDGNLYGTTWAFGPNDCGTLFRINPVTREFSVMHSFERYTSGCLPSGPLIEDRQGRLYGTTEGGGPAHYGVVFKWSPTGKVRILKSFTDYPGPSHGVSFSATGTLYGTTRGGGPYQEGTAFKLQPDGTGYQVIHSFGMAGEGVRPSSPLLLGKDGNFYGTTSSGGACCGALYSMNEAGTVAVKHTFNFGGVLGMSPMGALTFDTDGSLYGATSTGGAGNGGVIYSRSPDGVISVVHAFDTGPNGRWPSGGLVLTKRHLYGTARESGTDPRSGTVFRIRRETPAQ